MRVLSIVHGPRVRAEVFGDVVLAEGHSLEEWSVVSEPAPPRPVDEYDAVLIFGGHMNVDEERKHPWLLQEDEVIRGLVERRVPLFGVCLGGQLLAKASGAPVGPLTEVERGFVRVTLSDEAADDPVFGPLPREFDAFEGHGYAFEVPEGAVELARSEVCTQAIRVGDCAIAIARARSMASAGASGPNSRACISRQTASVPSRSISSSISSRAARRSSESASARAPTSTSVRTRSGARRASASAAYPPIDAPIATTSPSTCASTRSAHTSTSSPRS